MKYVVDKIEGDLAVLENIIEAPVRVLGKSREEAEKFYEKNHTSKGRLQVDLEENEVIYTILAFLKFNYVKKCKAKNEKCK